VIAVDNARDFLGTFCVHHGIKFKTQAGLILQNERKPQDVVSPSSIFRETYAVGARSSSCVSVTHYCLALQASHNT
jgi:hypothetical protein